MNLGGGMWGENMRWRNQAAKNAGMAVRNYV
ncbi:hypothetical protein EATG_02040 [Escherichia coli H605]|uniref:Uncharacterized protein n=1 Tax=Escherichia coli H605 TaxID=656410 RepID=A0AAJ3NXA6_ECOLX|nr:hypothetical protein EATG_02040 [Escherichia coli H605]